MLECPLGKRRERHAGARPQPDQLERREQEQRCAQNERREGDEAQRVADEWARELQVIADDGLQRAPRQASITNRHQAGEDQRRNHREQDRNSRFTGAGQQAVDHLRRMITAVPRCERAKRRALIPRRGERLLRHRIDGHRGFGFPRVEALDDEHDAIHPDPVAGEGADVRCTRRAPSAP